MVDMVTFILNASLIIQCVVFSIEFTESFTPVFSIVKPNRHIGFGFSFSSTSLDDTAVSYGEVFDLIIDTRAQISSSSNGTSYEDYYYVDTALVTDLLIEVFGAQTVVASKKSDDKTNDDIFDEPNIDYSKSDEESIHSLSLLPESSLSSSRPRQLWTNAEIAARIARSESESLAIENQAASIIKNLENILIDGKEIQLELKYRIEYVNLETEYAVDWCKLVQANWPPSVLAPSELNLGPPIIAALQFHTEEDYRKVVNVDEKYDKIVLEGGSAFGTGDHPTAKLCTEWLLRNCVSDEIKMIDYGSGSGILGLVALMAAKRNKIELRVEGVEVDPVAISAARRNCVLNGYNDAKKIDFFAPMKGAPGSKEWDEETGVTTGEPTEAADPLPLKRKGYYDIVIANIVAKPLISLCPTLVSLSKPETGRIALSGLQTVDIDAVMNAYTPYYDMTIVKSSGDWVLLEGQIKS